MPSPTLPVSSLPPPWPPSPPPAAPWPFQPICDNTSSKTFDTMVTASADKKGSPVFKLHSGSIQALFRLYYCYISQQERNPRLTSYSISWQERQRCICELRQRGKSRTRRGGFLRFSLLCPVWMNGLISYFQCGMLGDGRSQRSKRTNACKRTRILINERLLYEGGCARATTRGRMKINMQASIQDQTSLTLRR